MLFNLTIFLFYICRGAYLYRKERKKPPANTNQNKRSRVFDDEVSSGSSKQAEEDAVASDSSGSVTSGGVGVETRPVEIPTVSNVNISLGPGLRYVKFFLLVFQNN